MRTHARRNMQLYAIAGTAPFYFTTTVAPIDTRL